MEVLVVAWALITVDALVVARYGLGHLRGARRRAFLERRLGIGDQGTKSEAPRSAAAGITPPSFA